MIIGMDRTPKARIWGCWTGTGDKPDTYFILANKALGPKPKPARVRIILDTDTSGDRDDAGALALLHALADRDEFPHDARPDDQMPDALDVSRRMLAAVIESLMVQPPGHPLPSYWRKGI